MNQNQTTNPPQVSQSELTEGLGAILTYTTLGHKRPCGQTIGANGAGEFAVLIYGAPDAAYDRAKSILDSLKRSGHRIEQASIVQNEEGYFGPVITTEHTSNAEITGGDRRHVD